MTNRVAGVRTRRVERDISFGREAMHTPAAGMKPDSAAGVRTRRVERDISFGREAMHTPAAGMKPRRT